MSLPKLFKAVIKTNTHCINISIKDGRIHLFKYNNRTCDFAVFDSQEEAGEYMLEPLPTIYYQVTVKE